MEAWVPLCDLNPCCVLDITAVSDSSRIARPKITLAKISARAHDRATDLKSGSSSDFPPLFAMGGRIMRFHNCGIVLFALTELGRSEIAVMASSGSSLRSSLFRLSTPGARPFLHLLTGGSISPRVISFASLSVSLYLITPCGDFFFFSRVFRFFRDIEGRSLRGYERQKLAL